MAEDFRVGINGEEPLLGRGQLETAAGEGASDGHGMAVLKERMRLKICAYLGHGITLRHENSADKDRKAPI
jgi:hypothetical protein